LTLLALWLASRRIGYLEQTKADRAREAGESV